ncbi:MAG: hypothetical protein JWN17_500 [Frankiales bacterium]|nr:hypothetical protein [Frankiales bacterium]
MTLLAVLATWTVLSLLVAALCSAVFEGARRTEAAALATRPVPSATSLSGLPVPRASVEHLVRLEA